MSMGQLPFGLGVTVLAVDPAWAIPINTALLLLIAVVGMINRRDNKDIKQDNADLRKTLRSPKLRGGRRKTDPPAIEEDEGI